MRKGSYHREGKTFPASQRPLFLLAKFFKNRTRHIFYNAPYLHRNAPKTRPQGLVRLLYPFDPFQAVLEGFLCVYG